MKPAICIRLIACLAAMDDVASSYQHREPFIINQINYTMKRFEYRTLDVSANRGFWGGKVDIQELTDELNRLGREGWEIASSVDLNWGNGSSRNVLIMLKREVS